MARQRYDLQRPDGAWECGTGTRSTRRCAARAGAVRAVLHQTDDVTERVHTEQAAAQAEVRAARVLERMRDAHVTLDGEFRFTYVNAAAERALGKARGEMLGRTHWDVFPASVDTEAGRAYRRVVVEGIDQHVTQHYVGEGYDRHLEIDAYPTDEGGVAIFWRDVTARVRAEADVARFQRLVEHSNDAQYLIDEQGRIRWANRLASERTGYAPGELTRLTVGDLNPLISTRAFGDYFARARAGRAAPFESLHRHKDGTTFPVEITPTVADLPEGPRMLAAVRDVSERKRAEAALRESEQRFRLMADAVPQIVWMTDPDGRVEFFNQQWTHYTGVPYEPTTAAAVAASFVHPDDGPATVAAFDEARRTGGTFAVEHRIRSAAGDYRWFLVRAEPYRDPATGRIVRWFGASVDIHDRKQAEHELERARAEAEAARAAAEAAQDRAEHARQEAAAANEAKSAFLATMSHELRTPVNAVLGYAQLLDLGLAGPVTEHQHDYLGRLARSSHHLLGLVNDVLDLSKIEAGATRVARADGMTGPAVGAALDVVAPAASARAVRLVDARPDEAGVPFVGDEDRVRQVAVNLLSNAVKFTPPGGTVTVTCETVRSAPPAATHLRGEGPWALVRIVDTGVGIAPEEQGRIFEPFVQVEGGHTRTAGGTGLGLAISRRLARLMGGDLSVESVPGVGSAFTLWLPAARHEAGQPDETAAERSVRAERELTRLETPGLAEVGEVLHGAVARVLAAYTDRLRADPAVPGGRAMTRLQLEDHAISFLADLAQSLVIVATRARRPSSCSRTGARSSAPSRRPTARGATPRAGTRPRSGGTSRCSARRSSAPCGRGSRPGAATWTRPCACCSGSSTAARGSPCARGAGRRRTRPSSWCSRRGRCGAPARADAGGTRAVGTAAGADADARSRRRLDGGPRVSANAGSWRAGSWNPDCGGPGGPDVAGCSRLVRAAAGQDECEGAPHARRALGREVAAHAARQVAADRQPEPHPACARESRWSACTNGSKMEAPVRVVVEQDVLGPAPQARGGGRVEQQPHRRAQHRRPALDPPERRRGPVERAAPRRHLGVAEEHGGPGSRPRRSGGLTTPGHLQAGQRVASHAERPAGPGVRMSRTLRMGSAFPPAPRPDRPVPGCAARGRASPAGARRPLAGVERSRGPPA
jgi:PAS domain S-box-containing protein